METYKTIRFYRDMPERNCVVLTGLTLEQAKRRCSNPETSSSTAMSEWATRHTEIHGDWFEGFTKEDE